MENGYHQIAIHEPDIPKTAFVTPFSYYEFLHIPFGLSTAPRTFQRCLVNLFENCSGAIVYLDDLLLHILDVPTHLQLLSKVFEIPQENHIKPNLPKCSFMTKKINYLGTVVSGNKIRPCLESLPKFEELKMPTSLKKLRHFIGFSNWFRPFVPNLSSVLAPLNKLLNQKNYCGRKQTQQTNVWSGTKFYVLFFFDYPILPLRLPYIRTPQETA